MRTASEELMIERRENIEAFNTCQENRAHAIQEIYQAEKNILWNRHRG
jgi:hypothetical protein